MVNILNGKIAIQNKELKVKSSTRSSARSGKSKSGASPDVSTLLKANLSVIFRNVFAVSFCLFSLFGNQAVEAQPIELQPGQLSLNCYGNYLYSNDRSLFTPASKVSQYNFEANSNFLVSDAESGVPLRETPLAEPTVSGKENEGVDLSDLEQVTIQLTGPMCMVCLRRLEGRLITLPGVELAKVEPPAAPTDEELKNPSQLKKRTALVNLAYDPRKVSIGKIKEWIKANDFQVKSITKQK